MESNGFSIFFYFSENPLGRSMAIHKFSCNFTMRTLPRLDSTSLAMR